MRCTMGSRRMLLLGLPFAPIAASGDWHEWPSLPDSCFRASFSGCGRPGRDSFLMSTPTLDQLQARIIRVFRYGCKLIT